MQAVIDHLQSAGMRSRHMFKLIGAIIGITATHSIWGAFLGLIIGGVIDSYTTIRQQFQRAGGGTFTAEDLFNYYQQRTTGNDFATMLMALSAAVMKADGKVLKVELDYVKAFFRRQFGPQFSTEHLQTLKRFLDSGNIPLEQICHDIRVRTQEEVRVHLLHYLFGIAKADGHVAESEMAMINRIAQLLGVPAMDFDSVKHMFYRDVNSDYKVLGLEPGASDEEIKKAYRQMVSRYHPDKVSQMGEEYQKGAEEKFRKVQEAYENIRKSRN